MRLPDKRKLLETLVQHLSEVATQMTAIAQSTRQAATHEEAKPENDKDTRALEQSYLARGQAMRVEELLEQREQLRFFEPPSYADGDAIGAGALVHLESDQGDRHVFLSPHGGGTELTVDGCKVLVISPQSPLGAQLLGRACGDELQLRVRGTVREYVVCGVC